MGIRQVIKKVVNVGLATLDLQVNRRTSQDLQAEHFRLTMEGALEHAKKLGCKPATVLDVGAAHGLIYLYDAFPEARHILIEPLEENRVYLEKLTHQYQNLQYVSAVAGRQAGKATLHVHPDLLGSSLFLEEEDSDVNGTPVEVEVVTLDELCAARNCKPPYLIKIDTQGAELEVLAGAMQVLEETELLLLEVSLFRFFRGGPLFHDVIAYMKERGFVVYDILDFCYRPLDGALCQVNLVFVKDTGRFREHHFYATKEQRQQHTKALLDEYKNIK